jgi:hypothetical protein
MVMSRYRGTLLRILATACAAALVIGGIFAAGHWLKDDVRRDQRYRFSVRDVECEPPAGSTREHFLSEVHYYGQLPETMNVLDEDLSPRLREAFGKHPKVKRIKEINITAPNRVRVVVEYKQ